jgi:hypothetical protein
MNRKFTAALLVFTGGAILAAGIFIADYQPYGYIAPPALNSTKIFRGDTVAYTPWFERTNFKGDLIALPVASNGVVNVLSPIWHAATELDAQDYDTGRRIVTTDGAGTGIPFRWDELTAAQQTALSSDRLVDYVRGDRSLEGSGLRTRASVLGAIIHSGPVYVRKAISGYVGGGYLSYAAAQGARAPRIYVGANDGMLHSFDADTGEEVFAYIPSMIIPRLGRLTLDPYRPTYFVDGTLTSGDVYFDGAWRTVLVGGLGAGGKGLYALDVTDADAATEVDAAAKVLWEFTPASAGGANLGYTYSRPSIVRLNTGQWAAVVGNGYLSSSGTASLLFLDIETGTVITEITVPDASGNGLSSPTLIDTTGDRTPDLAYAGDLNGNLWKFHIGSASAASWKRELLFQTDNSSGTRQAITTAPEVGHHPEDGYMVYIATGRLFSTSDGDDKTQQAAYGIWDNDWVGGNPAVDIGDLLTQQIIGTSYPGTGERVRTATDNEPDWNTHRGWWTPLEIAGAVPVDQGERTVQDIALSDGRVQISTVNPSVATGDNWYLQLDGLTGGAPPKTIIDLNGDFKLNVADNADGDGDTSINDKPEDRVVGQFQSFGLASRAVFGSLSGKSTSAALINHLASINPNDLDVPTDPGLLGGHFDLDTSHLIYDFGEGDTDGHVHEWDDKWDSTTIDFLDLPDAGKLFNINDRSGKGIGDGTQPFILTISNTEYSPGGVLEINGPTISVTDYQALFNRYLNDELADGEEFRVLQFDAPGQSQQADEFASKGGKHLHDLKLSFDAYAILNGDLIPTKTGCVRDNEPGAKGEYRNGALMIQALDATGLIDGKFVYDEDTDEWVSSHSSLNATHGYATSGLLWEATVFWHWDGDCYGEDSWEPEYETCIVLGLGNCYDDEEAESGGGMKGGMGMGGMGSEPPPSEIPPGPPVSLDPGHSVTNTTIGGNNDLGPLFWRELIPED